MIMPINKSSKNNLQSKFRYHSRDKQIVGSPLKAEKLLEKMDSKNTLLCILKIKFNSPKETNQKKKISPHKEEHNLIEETSPEDVKVIRGKNIEGSSIKKFKKVSNSNEKDKNYLYNQFNITNQIFTMKRKAVNKVDHNFSIEGARLDIKTPEHEIISTKQSNKFPLLPKILSNCPPKSKPSLIIESTQLFTLLKVTKNETSENIKEIKEDKRLMKERNEVRSIKDILPKVFKEDKSIESDPDILNHMLNNDLSSFKIVKTGNLFDNGYYNMRRLFNKNYNIVSYIEGNNSNQINLNSYTYGCFLKKDSFLVNKVMAHRINWTQTSSKTNYNFKWKYGPKGVEYKKLAESSYTIDKQKYVNHLEFHPEITDKRRMFINLFKFCDFICMDIFKIIPFTVILSIRKDLYDKNFKSFIEIFNLLESVKMNNYKKKRLSLTNKEIVIDKKYTDYFMLSEKQGQTGSKINISIPLSFYVKENLWIIKASDLCQGTCMKISNNLPKINKKIKKFFSGVERTFKDSDEEKEKPKDNSIDDEAEDHIEKSTKKKRNRYLSSSVVLQKYLENPLLYNGRKFDIRIWVVIDHNMNVFLFKEGHLKCSSEVYDVQNKNQFVHITNYSVQKHSSNFEKYEFGNEVSFKDFQKSLDMLNLKINIEKDIMVRIKKIIEITTFSVGKKLNRRNSRYCFELLGYDFIIDNNFDVWLLEVNDNPGLCESSPLIKILVPRMIDDALRLTIDKVFNTKYSDNIMINNLYKSPFPVPNYSDYENMYEFLCNVNIGEEDLKRIRDAKSHCKN